MSTQCELGAAGGRAQEWGCFYLYLLQGGVGGPSVLRRLEYNSTHFLIDFFKNGLLLMLVEVYVVAVQCAGWGWLGGGGGV